MPFGLAQCNQRSRQIAGVAIAAALLAAPRVSRADEGEVRELRVRPAVEIPLVVLGGAGWVGSELSKPALAPEPCRWCDSVPGIDRSTRNALKWENTHAADSASDVMDFFVLPALVFGGDALLASQHGA